MQRSRRWLLSSLLLATGLPRLAQACAFDGIFDGSFGYKQPSAVEVALALRHAVASGLLREEALRPLTPGAAGLWEAVSILQDLGRRMSHAPPTSLPSANLALLFSESSLWTRYVRTQRGFESFIHADGPEDPDVVLVTDLAVVKALEKAQLSISLAIARNLLILEGSSDSVEAVEVLLRAAYEDGTTTATDLTTRLPWRRSGLR